MPRGKYSVLRDALYSMLRLIGRHVDGFFGAIAAFVTVSLIVALAATAVFAGFAAIVVQGFTQVADERVLQWIQSYRSDSLNRVMLEITSLGAGSVLALLVLVASVFLWLTHHRWSVYILFLGILGGQIVNRILKDFFERPRPTVVDAVTDVASLSFPSGHAMTSAITYGSVAYLVARLEPTPRLRTATWILTILIVLAVGVSRMYLGVHYPSDVLAGYIGGIAWLAFVASTLTAVKYFATRRPETESEEEDLHAEEQRAAGARS